MRPKLLFCPVLSLLAASATGQRLYHKDMDAAAQQAVKAMEKVDTKKLFDEMLDNLSRQSKQDYDSVFSGIRRSTRDRIQNWDNWCAVHSDVVRTMQSVGYAGLLKADPLSESAADVHKACSRLLTKDEKAAASVEAENTKEWTGRIAELAKAKADLQKQADALRSRPEKSEPGFLAFFDELGNLSEVDRAVSAIERAGGAKLKQAAQPVGAAAGIVERLAGAYKEFGERADQIANLESKLKELGSAMLKISIEKVEAEQEHCQRLIAIEARRAADLRDTAEAFEEYRNVILCERQQDPGLDVRRIDESLRALGKKASKDTTTPVQTYVFAARQLKSIGVPEKEFLAFCRANPAPPRASLDRLSRALFQAASVVTRGGTPKELADLRRAQEEQRYSVVQSSLEARAYETLVNTGIQRLALLHSGGIKPGEVAQLVYQAGQLAGVSLIAAKQ